MRGSRVGGTHAGHYRSAETPPSIGFTGRPGAPQNAAEAYAGDPKLSPLTK
ncbi:hypothetical protein [Streptomyces sp. AK04-3B]|uniref:hypothetical protein n=1 Tax=Streptomyces sp. AK04-3B TaxID=3028650 RepID=UPI0029B3F6D6|nr:hypothetical protein [Streptomyces sp. AK04-3B]MDX3802599.1 hypothetical protein [Streptomyces sp. AK04-3B]